MPFMMKVDSTRSIDAGPHVGASDLSPCHGVPRITQNLIVVASGLMGFAYKGGLGVCCYFGHARRGEATPIDTMDASMVHMSWHGSCTLHETLRCSICD